MTRPILIFDLGGVFVELTGVDQMREWTQHRMDVDELWSIWLTSDYVKGFERGQMDEQTFARGIIEEYGLSVESDEFLSHFSSWASRLFPGSRSLLNRLKDSYTLASLSNTNHIHWTLLCNNYNLGDYFHHNFPSHEVGSVKPDMEIFTHVIKELSTDPDQLIFFDDTRANIEQARNAGIQAYQVVGLDHLNQTLSDLNLT